MLSSLIIDDEHVSESDSYTFENVTSNHAITAIFELETYTIAYNLDGQTVSTTIETTYTVETESFMLNTPSKAGYTFIGWTGSNGTIPQTEVTIPKGSTGNRTYIANWQQL